MTEMARPPFAPLQPELDPEIYVFVSLPGADWRRIYRLDPVAMCREREGVSLVITHPVAVKAGLDYQGRYRRISLNLTSALDAVGLTAMVSGWLAEAGIAANMVAGHWHDHVFVPASDAERALCVLQSSGA